MGIGDEDVFQDCLCEGMGIGCKFMIGMDLAVVVKEVGKVRVGIDAQNGSHAIGAQGTELALAIRKELAFGGAQVEDAGGWVMVEGCDGVVLERVDDVRDVEVGDDQNAIVEGAEEDIAFVVLENVGDKKVFVQKCWCL